MRRLNRTLTTGILLALLILIIFSIFWALSPAVGAAPAEVSPLEANKILAEYVFEELLNEGHLAVADEIFAANFRQHVPNLPSVPLGSAGMKLLTMLYRAAFFDLHYTIEDMIVAGDKVMIRWTASGLHQREFDLYAPSGKRVTWSGTTIYRITNGQIVEAWIYQDEVNFLKQLGATTLTETTWSPSYR
jgi:predicted ester cyclase